MSEPEYDPAPDRRDPPFVAEEAEMLEAWLDFHRATLLSKCDGLDDEQLRRRSVPPSSMSLLGLVRHMTEVENNWFGRILLDRDVAPLYYSDDDPDGDFDNTGSADVEADMATYRDAVAAARQSIVGRTLDDVGARLRRGVHEVSLRWIMVHMIEEYARHNGHADLLRETIDGRTGE